MYLKKFINDIKNRSILIFLNCGVFFFISFINKETLLFIYLKPCLILKNNATHYFITTCATEIFYAYLKIILHINTINLLFFIFFHFLFFNKPGLFYSEIKIMNKIQKFLINIGILYLLILYNYLLPKFWELFCLNWINFTGFKFALYFEPKLSEYLKLFVTCININLIVSLLSTFCISYIQTFKLPSTLIKKKKKYGIYCIFFITALITPPDLFCQIYLGFFFFFFFELIFIWSIFFKLFSIRQPIKTN